MAMSVIQAACNICGGTEFGPGPAQRMSDSGKPPHCVKCGSLERHRANRGLFLNFPIGALSWRRALQFSPDMALNPSWFSSFEVSVYGGHNSLDLQKIDRPDESYDFVSLSHVLEFVPDDHASFNEIIRILSPRGLLHLVLSQPLGRPNCLDFASATGIHQYFHLYGQDFAERFRFAERGLHLFVAEASDSVTGVSEAVHLITKSAEVLEGVRSFIPMQSR
ncbi:methyltransferase domain-containing protein [Azospirillum isscasi]|uniref:Methyltransferase domain-containing protein n=1 Tax=Azospirillum isscasi TaxID=3053926 RepID=A0ABU0WGX3_9PROT|nr:methyltransferase domain-containing protein [Azospirillum isscasi]MDQ2103337.1 methyltransferase domain-containing protein [Azospirillum isscasi]